MPVYAPENPELGKNAIARRVAALRVMNEAKGPKFKRYDRSGARPAYQVEVADGPGEDASSEVRSLETREVPAYVLGAADIYPGIRAHIQEALDAALAAPEVKTREDLLRMVLAELDERCGNQLRTAAGYFTGEGASLVVAAV